MGRRVRARGLHDVCRPRALTRRYRELLQSSTSASDCWLSRALAPSPPCWPFSGLCPWLHLADMDRMQVWLLAQLFLAQTCPLAEGAEVRSDFLPNFAVS